MIYFVGEPSLLEHEKFKVASVEDVQEYFKDHKVIALDTETTGRDPHVKKIISLQLGDTNNQFVIDTRQIPIQKFKDLIESRTMIIHNSKFDYKFLKAAGIIVEHIYDTFLAELVIYCGYENFGYGLAALTKRYCDVTLNKETRGEFFRVESQPFTTGQIEYAALDVAYLHIIKELQEEKLSKYDLSYCANLEFNAIKALADIEWNGMYLNAAKWAKNVEDYEIRLQDSIERLDRIVISEPALHKLVPPSTQLNIFGEQERRLLVNYSSPSQMKEIFSMLGYDVESTDDRQLQKLKNSHEFFEELMNYREVAKVISTYGLGFLRSINTHTNRVHTDFWPILNTGRVSSGNKVTNAPNLQNIPASNQFRNCFEARPGFMWVSADYSGQELRLMADGSGEPGFIDVLNRGEDLHCYAGSMMFKRPITKEDKELRNKAKTINFGSKRL